MVRKQKKKQTRKEPKVRKCKLGCPCKDAGFLYVINDGQFKTVGGRAVPDKEVRVLCNNSKGEWIRLHSNKLRLPTYDPKTMRLPGEEKEPEPEPKPRQTQFF